MSKLGFSWVTPILCVSNLVKSLEHYEKVFGFEINWKWSESATFGDQEKPTFACVCRGEISIFLCENCQGIPGAWLSLNVRNRQELSELHTEYRLAGAEILEEPLDRSWGMCEMIVRDPDGNIFRVGCPIGE